MAGFVSNGRGRARTPPPGGFRATASGSRHLPVTAGDASDTSPPATVWARIKAHKVLQWSLAYLGAALAVAHGQEILGHTYHWPYVVERILIGGLIVGLPIAIALAWYHGHRGLTRVSSGELMVVSTLLVVGARERPRQHRCGVLKSKPGQSQAAPRDPTVRQPEPGSCECLLCRRAARGCDLHARNSCTGPRGHLAHDHDAVPRGSKVHRGRRKGAWRDPRDRRVRPPRGASRSSDTAAHRWSDR